VPAFTAGALIETGNERNWPGPIRPPEKTTRSTRLQDGEASLDLHRLRELLGDHVGFSTPAITVGEAM
jgi:hypothetical protein